MIDDATIDATLDDAAWTDASAPDPVTLQALHSLAQQTGLLQKQVNAELEGISNADGTVDLDQFARDYNQVQQLHAQFNALAAQYNAENPYAQQVALLNTWYGFTAEWLGETLQAVGQLPTTIANYIGNQLNNVGKAAISASLPWVLGIIGIIVLANSAEKTRTYRKYVA